MVVLSTLDLPPSNLCIIRLSAIGDTCHTVPVVRAIRSAWPDTQITWIVGRVEHGLLSGLEGVEFVVLDKSRGTRGYFDIRRKLRGRYFDLVLHLHASMRANLVSLMVPSKIRLGFDRDRARDYQWLFCNERIPPTPRQHVMDGLFEFPTLLGVERGPLHWDIPVSADDERFATEHTDGPDPVLLISPCTGQRFRNFRNWSVAHYAEIADYASIYYGAKVILTGGPTPLEREYGEQICEQAQVRVVNLIGRTTLKQLLALLEHATVLVCPDSGPAHMATAVGTPVVGLYATSNRHRTGPYASQHLVVDKYPDAVRNELGVEVEQIRWGQRVRNPDAMNLITVPDVVEKLSMAFAERGIEGPQEPADDV